MNDWDFEDNEIDPKILNKNFNIPKSQRADAKRRWLKDQICPMEDIREFEKKVLYNESKNNRN